MTRRQLWVYLSAAATAACALALAQACVDPLPPAGAPAVVTPQDIRDQRENQGPWKIQWARAVLPSERDMTLLNGPQVYGDVVLINDDTDPPRLHALDVLTGDSAWVYTCRECAHQWNNEIKQSAIDRDAGLYVGLTDKELIGVDLATRATRWTVDLRGNDIKPYVEVSIHGGYSYISINRFEDLPGVQGGVLRVDNATGEWAIVAVLDDVVNDFPYELVSPPAFYEDAAAGRTLMIVSVGHHDDTAPPGNPQSVVAFDAATFDTVWHHHRFTVDPGGQGVAPGVIGDELYLASDQSVNKLDPRTGEFLWRTRLPSDFPGRDSITPWVSHAQFVADGGYVYANPGSPDVYRLDRYTGAVDWHNDWAAATCAPTQMLYGDVLVTKSWGFGMHALDRASGASVAQMRGYGAHAHEFTPFAYDARTDQFFTYIGGGVLALKLEL